MELIWAADSKSNKKVRKHMGVVKLCWNEFLSKSKKWKKHMGVVKLCKNEFLSKANNKNVIKSGGGVELCWNDFLSKSNKKWENIWELSNYVIMTKKLKKWGWLKLRCNDFLKSKKSDKTYGVVKLCWNDFPSNLQHFTFSRGIWQLKQFVSISICTFRWS